MLLDPGSVFCRSAVHRPAIVGAASLHRAEPILIMMFPPILSSNCTLPDKAIVAFPTGIAPC